MNVFIFTSNQFRLVSPWKQEENGPKYLDGTSQYIVDESTGDRYWNETKAIVAIKLFSGIFATPLYHLAVGVIQAVFQFFKIITFSHFWMSKEGESSYSFENRLGDLGKELVNIISLPFVVTALEASAVYGLLMPYDGRKLYASFERVLLNDYFLLFPCFQPNPERHLLGGDPLKRDSF